MDRLAAPGMVAAMAFQDHFSGHAAAYAEHRPHYPATLFAWLAEQAPGRDTAWDCGTGNGQAAVPLAEHFGSVWATDPSSEQIAHAEAHERVSYGVAGEAVSGLPAASTDLVTAAQAYHWFEPDAFHAEARRVLRRGGLVAVWCYGLFAVEPAVDAAIARFYSDVVGPYWPPERRHVESGYRTLPFPVAEIAAPAFVMEQRLALDGVSQYLRTWSATKRYEKANGADPVVPLLDEIAPAWGDPKSSRVARFPLSLRVGRITASG